MTDKRSKLERGLDNYWGFASANPFSLSPFDMLTNTVAGIGDVGAASLRALQGRTRPVEDGIIAGSLAVPAAAKPAVKALANPIKKTLKKGVPSFWAAERPTAPKISSSDPRLPFLDKDSLTHSEPIFPGVWEPTREVAEKAAANTSTESPWLNILYNTSRGELAEGVTPMSNAGVWSPRGNAKGTKTSNAVLTDANAERVTQSLRDFERYAPELYTGMKGWYNMEPLYKQLVQQHGVEEGERLFRRMNSTGFFSPASPVDMEINRGTGLLLANKQGWVPQFMGPKPGQTGPYPNVRGMMAWRNQAEPAERFINSPMGSDDIMSSMLNKNKVDPKVPLYVQSSLPEHMGGQTRMPVPDAHFSRSLGFPEVRPWGADAGKRGAAVQGFKPNVAHLKSPEYTPVPDWFYGAAQDAGLEGVPAQAIMWGGYGHGTGVKTKVGAPKLEIMSDNIARRFRELNNRAPDPANRQDVLDMQRLRDRIHVNDDHASLAPNRGAPFGLA